VVLVGCVGQQRFRIVEFTALALWPISDHDHRGVPSSTWLMVTMLPIFISALITWRP
jgi:hypothetical protein